MPPPGSDRSNTAELGQHFFGTGGFDYGFLFLLIPDDQRQLGQYLQVLLVVFGSADQKRDLNRLAVQAVPVNAWPI
jgi:hypothetical protein